MTASMKNTPRPRQLFILLMILLAVLAALPAFAQDDDEERHQRLRQVVRIGPTDCDESQQLGTHGYLGVEMTSLTPDLRRHFGVPEASGVMVGSLDEDSPAAQAGLQVGDVITRFDGEDVDSSWSLTHAVRGHDGGTIVDVEYWRDGKVSNATVTLGEKQRCGFDLSPALAEKLELQSLRIQEQIEKSMPDLETFIESHQLSAEQMEKAMERMREAMEGVDWEAKFESQMERMKEIDMKAVEERLREATERLHELEEKMHQQELELREMEEEGGEV